MEINKDAFRNFKNAGMLNKGEPLLKKTKTVVVFDPANPQHVEVARILFVVNLDLLRETSDMSPKERNAIRLEKEELKKARENLTYQFKLEPPFTSVKDLVYSRLVEHAVKKNKEFLGNMATKSSILHFKHRR